MKLWNFFKRSPDLVFISDQADWIFDSIVESVSTELARQFRLKSQNVKNAASFKGKLLHFINRYAYFNGHFRQISPTNKVFVSWFHGSANDADPNIRKLFDELPATLPHLEKLVVSCSITRQNLIDARVSPDKLVTIPLGIDLNLFQPASPEQRLALRQKLGIPANALCIGSFQKDGQGWGEGNDPKPIKGPDVFLDVIARVAPHYPNLMVMLTGPARGYVKQGLDKLGVRYLHHLLPTYAEVVPYYQILDAYVIASRVEGGPSALLESWATGTPLVSSRVGMPADLIRHGENGLLAEVENPTALADHLQMLLEDTALRERCRQQALLDAQHYSWAKIAARYYHDLYT